MSNILSRPKIPQNVYVKTVYARATSSQRHPEDGYLLTSPKFVRIVFYDQPYQIDIS